MLISRKILIAALALGVVAIEAAAAPAGAATSTTTLSVGITIVAPENIPARRANSGSTAGVERTSTGKAMLDSTSRHDIRRSLNEPALAEISAIAKTAAIKPEVTTHQIVNARADSVVLTLSY